MTPGFESNLRDGLQRLADAPPAPAMSDRALAGARRLRLRRRGLAALAAIAVLGVGTAVPLLLTTHGGTAPVGSGPTGTALTGTVRPPVDCRTATNEAVPPGGAVPDTWPSFVGIVMAHLPPRDDYHLDSAVGLCGDTGQRAGRMVMGIGPGHLVVELYPDFYQMLLGKSAAPEMTCSALAARWQDVYFCADATPTEPLAVGGRDERGDVYVLALYPDGRWIVLEDVRTNLPVETMRAIVTDPALAALLG